ncbi:uncharacterized protein CTHT_0003790 [Thermochaetoides thermophila DSM 1495]|uniref:Uncharacterized protein n=1 Tax=Chaetomium thermophilum (strain DSM 1495 / CBS 144.50 / IMI 039719) TaxID=759272 RepID=G0RZQ4_CHATD|nr:hypothetical protein CTHT_0003790 [Thermochaetoides thermophila DSM 1495]EGS23682.1 hypothetical protein CTHT_0003790 [Thermochaetoides thermophila DSM 1495]
MKTWRKFVEAVDWVSIRVELSAEMEEVKPVVMGDNGNMFEGARELEDTVKNFDSADELEIAEVDDSTSDVKEFIDEAIIELMRIEDLVEDVYDVLEEDKELVDDCDEVAGNDWVNTEVSVEVSVKVCDSLDVLPTEMTVIVDDIEDVAEKIWDVEDDKVSVDVIDTTDELLVVSLEVDQTKELELLEWEEGSSVELVTIDGTKVGVKRFEGDTLDVKDHVVEIVVDVLDGTRDVDELVALNGLVVVELILCKEVIGIDVEGSGTEEIDGGGVMDTERVFVAEPECLSCKIDAL